MPSTPSRGLPSRSTAAGVVIGSVSLAVGVVGPPPMHGLHGAPTARADAAMAPAVPARPAGWGTGRLAPEDQRRPGAGLALTRPTAIELRRARARRPARRSTHARRHPSRPSRPPARAARSATRRPLPSDPRTLGRLMVADHGWSETQWRCLDLLWTRESNWQVHETNASSGAYGIPQALPAGKMASAGPDWHDDAATQIRWGLGYIDDRYGTPCAAWEHSQEYDFY
ncbi:MAG: lytic transglycosylase domain-containing protein [Frankiaceae bacterium]